MTLLNQTKQDSTQAYTLLQSAAELGHPLALQKVAWAHLLGSHLSPNVSRTSEIFEKLSLAGHADAQMVGTFSVGNLFTAQFPIISASIIVNLVWRGRYN